MQYSEASKSERQKVKLLCNGLSKKMVDRPVTLELYDGYEVIRVEVVKKFDQEVVKYFLISPTQTVKASYTESLWEKELYKWSWGSKELNIKP